ncbi:ribose-5-phosphate isomerase [Clostridium rectalis]|uniref:ribose-5-phosphate isomerase n=1 Tax=Clostridium rectalis TaxID=2040295 RepID=UPI000F632AD1|nr:ribose-5-phosphate isomerase [Clostridium rectalis]
MTYFNREFNYKIIVKLLCEYKGLNERDSIKILEDEDCKHLLFLLLKKYNCIDIDELNKDFSIDSKKKIDRRLKAAEKKLLYNKRIREMYFEAENLIQKIQ